MLIFTGLFLLILKTCHAEYECYYSDGRTLYCDSCCEYECCEGGYGGSGGSGLSGGAVAGIVIAVIVVLALKVCCICARVRRRTTVVTRTVTVPRSVVVTTNTNHAGYDQRRIPTIHQPNPNTRTMPATQQTNPNHYGYDQQQVQFPPMPPPSYENVIKETPK